MTLSFLDGNKYLKVLWFASFPVPDSDFTKNMMRTKRKKKIIVLMIMVVDK